MRVRVMALQHAGQLYSKTIRFRGIGLQNRTKNGRPSTAPHGLMFRFCLDNFKFGYKQDKRQFCPRMMFKVVEVDTKLWKLTLSGQIGARSELLSHRMYLLMSLGKSTPPQNRQLDIFISNSKQCVDDFMGNLTLSN